MVRKIVSLSLALMLCLALIPAGAETTLSELGTYPLVPAGSAELSIFGALPGGMESYNGNITTEYIEKNTGVHINWQEVSNAEAGTSFTMSIASGEYPDIYFQQISGPDLLQYAEDGVIIPLNDLIENHSYYLKKLLDENPDVKAAITAPDGNIYSFPKIQCKMKQSAPNKMWVYKEWLERYMKETGSEKPQTPEELEKMLLFFRDNDMNGNGDPNDEIVMTGQANYGNDGGNPIYYLLNAFCLTPSFYGFFYFDENDNWVTNVLSDECREGLRYCNRLYEEGLIAEEAFVQELTTFRNTTSTTHDKVLVATAAAPYPFRLLTMHPEIEDSVTWEDYELLLPLKGKDGTAVTAVRREDEIATNCVITTACENPELAMRWMDFFYTDEMREFELYGGEEGTGWEWQDGKNLAGGDRCVVSLLDTTTRNQIWSPDWSGTTWTTRDMVTAFSAENAKEDALSIQCAIAYEPYAVDERIPIVYWCNDLDAATEFTELKTLINDYITTSLNEFTLGIRDIDSDADWDAYVNEVKNMGMDRYVELARTYYGK